MSENFIPRSGAGLPSDATAPNLAIESPFYVQLTGADIEPLYVWIGGKHVRVGAADPAATIVYKPGVGVEFIVAEDGACITISTQTGKLVAAACTKDYPAKPAVGQLHYNYNELGQLTQFDGTSWGTPAGLVCGQTVECKDTGDSYELTALDDEGNQTWTIVP